MGIFDDVFKDEDFLIGEEEEEKSEKPEMWSTGNAADLWTTDEPWVLGEEDYSNPEDEFSISDFFD
jgi:hypothetical protein